MRKIIVLEHISLDGVIQAPGGPDEDTSGGFAYGGWISAIFRRDSWNGPEKADEPAVRPVVRAQNL